LDALILLFKLADKGACQRAAGGSKPLSSAPELPLRDSEMVMNLLCGIRGANRLVIRRCLLEAIERAGLAASDIR
jgi:hypothetical protein